MRRSSRQGAIPSELGDLIDELDDIERRLGILETPSGEALGNTVAKLQALVSDIQAQLDAWTSTRYTNSEIDSKDAAVSASIIPTVQGASALALSGQLLVPNAYNTDITWTRRTAWWGNDGRAGYASSSRDKKTAITPADEAALLRLLEAVPKSFYYRAEIARRTSLRINEGEDYVPARELGLIAEELDELGLGAFVYHDEDGKAEGIEYAMLTVALLAIVRNHERRIATLEGAGA